jgi:hypothetical protein
MSSPQSRYRLKRGSRRSIAGANGEESVGHADPKTYDTIHTANTCRVIVWHATCFNTSRLGRGDVSESWNIS